MHGSRLAYIRNRQSKKPAREWKGFGALDRANGFGRIFLAEDSRRIFIAEIQGRELLDFQFKQIERLAHQTALDQFVRDNAAHAFDVECAARGEKFQPPSRLRRALNIFAAPDDKFRIAPYAAAADGTLAANVSENMKCLGDARALLCHALDHGRNDHAGVCYRA